MRDRDSRAQSARGDTNPSGEASSLSEAGVDAGALRCSARPPTASLLGPALGLLALWLALGLGLACAGGGARDDSGAAVGAQHDPNALITHARRLTFAGRRSGEGYFSKDARQLVFQSEREPGNPFYQIYRLDLQDGALLRISPGLGKTTCAWIHPAGGRILFASTHLDPDAERKQVDEIAQRASGEERRYAWDYDEQYDLFVATPDAPDTTLHRLTRARGYDAEASYSPDGRSIVFASNRHAHGPDGLEVDPEQYDIDPSYFVDIYIMDANGQNPRRLTESPGYDGGPFFSPDGRRIVWRRFSEDGATAEIFTMRTDGSDVRQITELGAMSWAPFYHPSGDYLVFTTNLHGFENFELYMVGVDGEHAPVRVSESPGFDGLPAFSPSGDEIVWTSNRGDDERSQLYIGTWNDAVARERLGLPSLGAAEIAPLLPLPSQLDPTIQPAELRGFVDALTSDVTDGRQAGTSGERIAASYVARAFRRIGLEPAGDDDTYYEAFGFTAGVSLGEGNLLVIETQGPDLGEGESRGDGGGEASATSQTFEVDRDWRPFAFSHQGETPSSQVVYAGYGIVAPAGDGQRAIDSYAGLEVKGRWVLVFRYMPSGLGAASRQHLHRYSSLRYKAMLARDRGALGLLVVSGPGAKVRNELAPLRFDVSLSGSSIAALSIRDAVGEALVAPSGTDLASLQASADADSGSRGFPLEGVRAAATVALVEQRRTGRNVLGRLSVGDRPTEAVVVVGAHFDHLGHGEGSNSLATPDEAGEIHRGADDNASGVAALLETAHALADAKQRGGPPLAHDILFAAWSGEEIGLLGSNHFVANAVDAHDPEDRDAALSRRVVGYLNFDMVGRMRERVSLFGVESSSIWERAIERANVPIGLAVEPRDESVLPTDATSFYLKGVPVLSAFTGGHSEYHTPRDVSELLDYEKLADITRLMTRIAHDVAARPEAPDFVAGQTRPRELDSRRVRVYLGTIPDYAQGDLVGLRLSGVSEGGPAALAGLRAGDVVVEIDGRAIENIYDYTFALDALRVGEPASVTVQRGESRVEVVVTPASRD